MKVLLISFYFPPDLSAGSFRAAALVESLASRGAKVDVLTATPNRYATVAANAIEIGPALPAGVTVTRIRVPAHQSGVHDQVKTFAVFAYGAWRAAGKSDADVVFATSSRLLTGSLGAVIARQLRKPLYLDVRDIFSETVASVFGGTAIRHLMPAISRFERWTLRSASRVNLVSPPFADYFGPLLGHRDFALFTNGIDDLFLAPLRNSGAGIANKRPVVLAAGNIGEGQGLDRIVPGLAEAHPNVIFRIVGDGGRRSALMEATSTAGLDNVELIDPVPREKLRGEYERADILFMHLNDFPAFRRVLPSKMFEYAATGKPILAGVTGYSRTLLKENVSGVATFNPCDVEDGARALRQLLAGPAEFDRSTFRAQFARRSIMQDMAEDIARIADSH